MADRKPSRSRERSRSTTRDTRRARSTRDAARDGGGSSGGGGGGGGGTGDGHGFLSGNDFPILTEEIDLGQVTRPSLPRGTTSSVDEIVERSLRDVLGWRPRAGDAKGFLAALGQSFTCVEVEGHTECRWTPRSYAVEIQADMGAVTGAQASIFTRAKALLEQTLPLLDGLQPLIPDYDRENVSAIRAIVRSQLTELVSELGVEGGPRVARVDQQFRFLVGPDLVPRDRERLALPNLTFPFELAEAVQGNLGVLRDRFGLRRRRINTIDEEQNYTNFLVVVDNVATLLVSWLLQRFFFDRTTVENEPEPYLGTQLVLLSRVLEVVSESVHEVEYAMDSVFLGPAERQTLELVFDPPHPPMFVSELLDWVERFASLEGPQLIEAGGKQGLDNFEETVKLLRDLVDQAAVQEDGSEAFQKRRVQRALEELARQLDRAVDLVDDIEPPELESPQTTEERR
jgi:hypothetical protein